MALALGVYRNQVVKVGEQFFTVTDIQGETAFKVAYCDKDGQRDKDSKILSITDKEAVSIFKDVTIAAGIGTHGMARVLISAPRYIKILRAKHCE